MHLKNFVCYNCLLLLSAWVFWLSFLCRLCRSAWVGCSSPSVCLFVCPGHNPKIKDPKVLKPGIGNDLGYPRSDMVLGRKIKGQGDRVSNCIFHTIVRHITKNKWFRLGLENDLGIFYEWYGFRVSVEVSCQWLLVMCYCKMLMENPASGMKLITVTNTYESLKYMVMFITLAVHRVCYSTVFISCCPILVFVLLYSCMTPMNSWARVHAFCPVWCAGRLLPFFCTAFQQISWIILCTAWGFGTPNWTGSLGG